MLIYSQVNEGNETGFFWRLMSKNSQMTKDNETFRGKKLSQKPLSVFVYANASGTQRLKLAILDKFKEPRALRVIMSDLPGYYFTSAKAWFASGILLKWFQNYFVPAVRRYQIHGLKIAPENTKPLLILDNAQARSSKSVLISNDGYIKQYFDGGVSRPTRRQN